jgi:hypothetical protein
MTRAKDGRPPLPTVRGLVTIEGHGFDMIRFAVSARARRAENVARTRAALLGAAVDVLTDALTRENSGIEAAKRAKRRAKMNSAGASVK